LKKTIDNVVSTLVQALINSRIKELKIIDKTRSILKARLFFSEDIFIQIYVNIRKPKRSYTLVINDKRIFGKDYVFGTWHTHPFEDPLMYYGSEESRKSITIEEFIEEATFILSEKLGII